MLYGFLFPVSGLWISSGSFVLLQPAKVDVNKDGNGANIFPYAFDFCCCVMWLTVSQQPAVINTGW